MFVFSTHLLPLSSIISILLLSPSREFLFQILHFSVLEFSSVLKPRTGSRRTTLSGYVFLSCERAKNCLNLTWRNLKLRSYVQPVVWVGSELQSHKQRGSGAFFPWCRRCLPSRLRFTLREPLPKRISWKPCNLNLVMNFWESRVCSGMY